MTEVRHNLGTPEVLVTVTRGKNLVTLPVIFYYGDSVLVGGLQDGDRIHITDGAHTYTERIGDSA